MMEERGGEREGGRERRKRGRGGRGREREVGGRERDEVNVKSPQMDTGQPRKTNHILRTHMEESIIHTCINTNTQRWRCKVRDIA